MEFIVPESVTVISALKVFEQAIEDELRAVIMSYGVSCLPTDPIHVNLLSVNVDFLFSS